MSARKYDKKKQFFKETDYNSVEGSNTTDIPILILHGDQDKFTPLHIIKYFFQ